MNAAKMAFLKIAKITILKLLNEYLFYIYFTFDNNTGDGHLKY